jgi:hypothetical protein
MARHRGPVLVDTNVILECWRIGAWRALTGGYSVETVEECVTETQTGAQRRSPEQRIDEAALRRSLAVSSHAVSKAELAAIAVRATDIALDAGEWALWAHALNRQDAWVLCGPDKASMRFGVRMGFRDRLTALETLLNDVGYNPQKLKVGYTSAWLTAKLGEFVVLEMPGQQR